MKSRVIRDPVYGYITLRGELAPIVDHPLFQRLRRVAQTSLTSAVYPAATGSRFEHALGAMNLASRAWRAAWTNAQPDVREAFLSEAHNDRAVKLPSALTSPAAFYDLTELAVAGTALMHDLGHPPFSHVLEPFYASRTPEYFAADDVLLRMWERSGDAFHEFAGIHLAKSVTADLGDPLRSVLLQVLSADPSEPSWLGVLHSVVSGEIDIDRLDYLIRDAQKAGTEFGAIDYARLVDAYELHQLDGFVAGPSVRARSAVETLLLQRTQTYKWIIFHPRVVCANLALAHALDLLFELADNDDLLRIGETELTSRDFFAPLLPVLNYVSPTASDVSAYTAGVGSIGPTATAQLELGGVLPGDQLAELEQAVRASIDDSVVVESVKRALTAARAVFSASTASELYRSRLARFITLARCAFFRHKNVVPAWKTVEEFRAAAVDMRSDLRDVIHETYSHFALQPRVASHPETLEAVHAERESLLMALGDDDETADEEELAVTGLNRIVAMLLDEADYKAELATALGKQRSQLGGLPGFWLIEYTGFTAVREDEAGASLFVGNERVRIFATSPLARALKHVEQSRPRLFAYFFVLHPARIEAGEPGTGQERRALLLGDFLTVFPNFVRSVLPAVLADTFQPPIRPKEDAGA